MSSWLAAGWYCCIGWPAGLPIGGRNVKGGMLGVMGGIPCGVIAGIGDMPTIGMYGVYIGEKGGSEMGPGW